jgi:arsenate reductase
MEITIFHNPACGTSVRTLAAIRAAGHEPEIFDYLHTPMVSTEITALLKSMNVSASDLVRNKEPLFRELGLDRDDVSEGELIEAMSQHPILINRPIVVIKNGGTSKAQLCRPSESVNALPAEANS